MDRAEAKICPSRSEMCEKRRARSISPAARSKIDRIWKACEDGPEIEALVHLATAKDGLVNDEVRQKACTSIV